MTAAIALVDQIAETIRYRLDMGFSCSNTALESVGYTAMQLAEAADKAREIVRKEHGQ